MKTYVMLLSILFSVGSSRVIAQAIDSSSQSSWQETINVIKASAKEESAKHNSLRQQQQAFREDIERLSKAIEAKNKKIDQLKVFLRERNGRTDQEMRIDTLNEDISTKKRNLAAISQEMLAIKEDWENLNQKVKAMQLKISDWELRKEQEIIKPVIQENQYDELAELRAQLEEEKHQEISLEKKFESLKVKQITQFDQELITPQEIEEWRRKKDLLVERLESSVQDEDRGKYFSLSRKKAELESKIAEYERRISLLKNNQAAASSWDKRRKQLIHQIVQADAKNSQMREKINHLREDVAVLRDQVMVLEQQKSLQNTKVR